MTEAEKEDLMSREYTVFQAGNMKLIQTPRYLHDCTTCRFFGRWKKYDLWAHIEEKGRRIIVTSLIARDGEGGNYYSGTLSFLSNPALKVCFKRVHRQYLSRVELQFVSLERVFELIASNTVDSEADRLWEYGKKLYSRGKEGVIKKC